MKHPFSLDITELELLAQGMTELRDEEIEKISGGSDVTTQAVGEEGGGGEMTTLAVGEEGGGEVTTQALGEEGGTDIKCLPIFPRFTRQRNTPRHF
jgi:hypothetical protein